MRHQRVNDIDLYIEGEGIPLLCLHGWTMDHTMWRYQSPLADRNIMLISYDRRGHGTRPDGDCGLIPDLHDISTIIDHLKLDRLALIGMSQGARIAHVYAHHHASHISHLILQSAPAAEDQLTDVTNPLIPIDAYRALIQAGEMDAFRDRWLHHPLMHCAEDGPRQHLHEMVERYRGSDLLSSSSRKAELTRKAEPSERSGVQKSSYVGPLLAITGDQEPRLLRHYADHLIDKHRSMSDQPAIRLDIQGHGHFTNMTIPHKVNDAIFDFISDHRSSAVA